MVRRPVHQVEDLLDGAVPCGAGGKLQPSAVEADEAPAVHGANEGYEWIVDIRFAASTMLIS